MAVYARYTEYTYDPDRRDEVFAYWRDPATTSPKGKAGFRAGYVLDSDEEPGRIRIVTLWDDPDSFERYFASDEHRGLGAQVAELSLVNTARDGLHGRLELEQRHQHVRIIRAEILDRADIPAIRSFWRERGRAVLESAAHRARAYVDEKQALFIVQLWWDSPEQADAFVASEAHRVDFEEPLAAWVRRLDRAETTPLDD